MVTKEFAMNYRDCYEPGMSVEDYVEFFHDCQKIAVEEDVEPDFVALSDEDLRELANLVIEINS